MTPATHQTTHQTKNKLLESIKSVYAVPPSWQVKLRQRLSDETASVARSLECNGVTASAPDKKALEWDLLRSIRSIFYRKAKCMNVKPWELHAVSNCRYARAGNEEFIRAYKQADTSFFTGLQTCESARACPFCSVIAEVKASEKISALMNLMLAPPPRPGAELPPGGFGYGFGAVMVTFTIPHYESDSVVGLYKKLAAAQRRFKSGRAWQRLKAEVGYKEQIKASEVTYGLNGWHPHSHEIWFVERSQESKESVARWLEEATERWIDCCVKEGLVDITDTKTLDHMRRRSFDVRPQARAGDYLAKESGNAAWGIDAEMSFLSKKKLGAGSVHPFQLAVSDEKHQDLFFDYVMATKGMPRWFYSRGLNALFKLLPEDLGLLVDEGEGDFEPPEEPELVFEFSDASWGAIRHFNKQFEVLECAKRGDRDGIMALISECMRYMPRMGWPPPLGEHYLAIVGQLVPPN